MNLDLPFAAAVATSTLWPVDAEPARLMALAEPLVQRLGWTLVHTLWQGVVFAGVLALLLRAMRTAPASTRYTASCGAMALMVLAAASTFALLAPASVELNLAPLEAPVMISSLPDAPASGSLPLPPVEEPVQSLSQRILRAMVMGWAAGVAGMALWHVAGWAWLLRVRRGVRLEQWEPALARLKRQLGVGRAVRLIETTRIDVPAVVGALRPVILVPAGVFSGLSPQQVEAILAHELAHVRRHDYLVNLVQAAVESLMFYHPATWWMSAQVRRERENCCDDLAAGACGGGAPAYAAALAALEERRPEMVATTSLAPSAAGGDLLDRVRRLLKLPAPSRRPSRARSLAAAALAIACVALPLVVTAQQPRDPATTAPAAGDVPVNPTTSPADGPTKVPTTAAVPEGGALLPGATQPSAVTDEDLAPKAGEHRFAPRDVFTVTITDLMGPGIETVKKVTVTATGTITVPVAGEVKVGGMTAQEAERAIAKAYKDRNILANAQVSVSGVESQSRNFSILGHVPGPGQYVLTKEDFRVLDALAMARADASNVGLLRVIRDEGKRVIELPIDRLLAGERRLNIVVRPGDMLIVAEPQKRFVKVVVGRDVLLHDGKPIDWSELHALFERMDPRDRRLTVLEVAAAAPDVTVERFFRVTAQLSDLVKQHGLANLSQTGIQPTTQPATKPAAKAPSGEYYISDPAQRPGVYSFAGRKISLKQAIVAAGGLERDWSDAFITVVRREGDTDRRVVTDVRLSDLMSGKEADPFLAPDDTIHFSEKPANLAAPATTRAAAAKPATRAILPAEREADSGEYYVGGKVQRAGVYSKTARKITLKQAIVAAGGFEDGAADGFITVVRRTRDGGESVPVADWRWSDILSGRQPDAYVQPEDVITVGLESRQGAAGAAGAVVGPSAQAGAEPRAATMDLPEMRAALRLELDRLNGELGPEHPHRRQVQRMNEEVEARIARGGAASADFRAREMVVLRAQVAQLEFLEADLSRKLGAEHREVKATQRLAELARQHLRAAAQAVQSMSVLEIASVDATMRDYLRQRDDIEWKLAKARRSYGENNLAVRELKNEIELHQQRIDTYAATWRKTFGAPDPPATQPGSR